MEEGLLQLCLFRRKSKSYEETRTLYRDDLLYTETDLKFNSVYNAQQGLRPTVSTKHFAITTFGNTCKIPMPNFMLTI